jgi:predicted transcriptional regulator
MDTREVAENLNVTARELRKFLRADPEFMNAGCGGKYTFELSDMPRLRKRYRAYKNGELKKLTPVVKRSVKKPSVTSEFDKIVESGMPITIARVHKLGEKQRRQRDIINAAREARLFEAMRAVGL